ncbi:MAG: type 3 dihydrofolate reductase [Gammaproteobacteria bacterium]|nr:type 3 dihydrofolate reductase [Gammaproteobacteria bacterium]
MKISLIAAMAHHRVIGKNNQLPWHLPADLKHFKALTTGKVVVMGRKTFEAIGKPLPNRKNIVLTHDRHWNREGVIVVHSWEQAVALSGSEEELIVIGGAQLYEQTLSKASTFYLTLIDSDIEGDAVFPEWNANEWQEVERNEHPADEKNSYNMIFITLKRMS